MSRNRSLVLICAAAAFTHNGAAADTVGAAFKDGKFLLDWRIRYETVDQAGFAETADALTSRLRAGFQTAEVKKTSLLAEAAWLEDAVGDNNSTTNGETAYPVVADPAGFAVINRFALTNKSLASTALTLGRQRIVHDDARFVGNVGWRQHEQTFDGLRAQLGGAGPLTGDLTYATQVNRVFGPDSPVGKWEGDIVLANVGRTFEWGRVSAFGYGLKLDDAAEASSNTLGVKLAGSRPLGPIAGTYALAYARQSDAGINPLNFDADYRLVEAGVRVKKVSLALGREVLGAGGAAAFTTPLATLHAFQGWADKFLATPAAGIDDRYVRIGYALGQKGALKSLAAVAWYHELDAGAGGAAFGDEIDLSLIAQLARMTFTVKYASYAAESLFTDTDKVWLSMDYAF